MKKLLDLIIYIFRNHPNKEELSKPRLVKIIYLIDWKYSIDFGKQITDIKWYYNHYGPYVDDIIELIRSKNKIFSVDTKENYYGGMSDKIKLIENDEKISLSIEEKLAADFIINNTAHTKWSEFISLVYSTFPILNNSKYTYLNLVEDAKTFKKILLHNQSKV